MFFSNTHTKQFIPNALSAVALLFFVLLYSIQGNRPETLHQLLHKHEVTVTHSLADEQDACHQAIYHASAAKGCEHPLHIVANDPCPVCELYFQTDQYTLNTFLFIQEVRKETPFSYLPSFTYSWFTLQRSSRAPPMA
jgi:hypothetical protein